MTSASLCPNTAPGGFGHEPFRKPRSTLLVLRVSSPTTTSYRISGLENGISYGVGAVAVDRFGNVSELSNIAYGIPEATSPHHVLRRCRLLRAAAEASADSRLQQPRLAWVWAVCRSRKAPPRAPPAKLRCALS